MSRDKLLDCTLRDGGYINDWNFGFHTIRDIIKKLVDSRVDYVEVGFLRNCEYDSNRALSVSYTHLDVYKRQKLYRVV